MSFNTVSNSATYTGTAGGAEAPPEDSARFHLSQMPQEVLTIIQKHLPNKKDEGALATTAKHHCYETRDPFGAAMGRFKDKVEDGKAISLQELIELKKLNPKCFYPGPFTLSASISEISNTKFRKIFASFPNMEIPISYHQMAYTTNFPRVIRVILDLSNSTITDEELEIIVEILPNIVDIDMENCLNLTEKGIKSLSRLKNLECLNLEGCEITDSWLRHLGGLSKLEDLNLSGCEEITGGGLAHLKTLSNLISLDLSSCDGITDEGLPHLSGFEHLTHLNLAGCPITGDSFASLAPVLENLTNLNLSWTPITDDGLASLTPFLKNVISLNLSCCDQLTDKGLKSLAALKKLTSLSLGSVASDAVLASVAELTNLIFLDLGHCKKITDSGLPFLMSLQKLRGLSLELCINITNSTPLAKLKHLAHLNVYGCRNIQNSALRLLFEDLPHLTLKAPLIEKWVTSTDGLQ
jgi:Leucine Rich Repeat (LRR) protein